MKPSGIITLLTDFGTRDGYVAAMKGVILGINPQARLIDLSHDIEPQDVLAGAFLLSTQSSFFPPGTVHVAVVDPGVGTSRRLLAVQALEYFYLAPDNGLLDFCIALGDVQVVEIANRELWRQAVSNTFHGRDILAPVAAHLSLGKPFQDIGTPVDLDFHLQKVACKISPKEMSGRVVYVDRFGNLITNITSRELREFSDNGHVEILLEGKHVGALESTYASVETRLPVVVIGGFDRLEIGVNGGSATKMFGAGVGALVTVRKKNS